MPKTYKVTLSDGRVFNVTTEGGPPNEAQVLAALGNQRAATPAPRSAGTATDVLLGAMKGLGSTVTGLGDLAYRYIPGVSQASDAVQRAVFGDVAPAGPLFEGARQEMQPTNTPQKVGFYGEQIGEYFIPAGAAERTAAKVATRVLPWAQRAGRAGTIAARGVPKMVAGGATAAGVSAAQGGDPTTAGIAGAVSPAVGGAINATGRFVGEKAIPMVRAGVKPTVTAMKQQAGASVSGINAQANKLARFMIDNHVTSPAKAERIIKEAETEIQHILQNQNALTDAAARAQRYMRALSRSAERQGLPGDDVATIRAKAAELLRESPLSEDVITTTLQPSPSGLLGPNGRPVMVPTQQTTRALRQDVMADEALDIGRHTSLWKNRKVWGEQKGAAAEANKAVERAVRDSAKEAVPDLRKPLMQQSGAITAKQVLDRQAFREANRDVLSLPGVVGAAPAIAHGKLPFLGMAAHWLRNNQVRAGVWANGLSRAIRSQDVQKVKEILERLGVGVGAVASE